MTRPTILRRAWQDVTTNRHAAVRIFGPAILAGWIIPLLISKVMTGQFSILLTFEVAPYAPLSQTLVPALGLMAIAWFAIAASVSWHRLILLSESPRGLVSQLTNAGLIPYFWRAFVWMLILIFAALVAMMGFGRLVGPESLSTPLFNLPITRLTAFLVILVLPIIYLGLRLSPMLVACVVDQKMRMRAAWGQSAGVGGALWGVAALLFAGFVLDKIIIQVSQNPGFTTIWLAVTAASWAILPPVFTAIYGAISDQSAAK
jgi:hypothetical protein